MLVQSGTGTITVNGKAYKEYFPHIHMHRNIEDPFATVGVEEAYDVKVNVKGGGFKGQAEATRMAISRALVKLNEEFRSPLKFVILVRLSVKNTVNQKQERASSSQNVNHIYDLRFTIYDFLQSTIVYLQSKIKKPPFRVLNIIKCKSLLIRSCWMQVFTSDT